MSPETAAAQPTVHLDTIGQIALTVRNLARSKAFYKDTLGIPFLFDAGTMAFFQCGAIRLVLGTSESESESQSNPDKSAHPGTILYFKVPDLHAIHAALLNSGVTFLQSPHLVAKMPGHDLWMAFLNDPDNNPIGLMSELPSAG